MKNELEALASELPILTDKSSYKYLSEVAFLAKVVSLIGSLFLETNLLPLANSVSAVTRPLMRVGAFELSNVE
ncbi:hypothetical protein P7X80_06095 [Lactiplantibacillus plantarum]|uniref:hypothetical protein n=1 Tax=Lactiplantibacillus plantarum TaxID=1590 RepID=UPI002802EDA8|nr:hypothetical protein [Lactiplantibacillus plantarum]MDQ7896223.1 hypothetical protein [Lactiplantibacillus plantarum]